MKLPLKIFIQITFLLFLNQICAQTISGVVKDRETLEPIFGASVYFDNTTYGTITDDEGKFTIELTEKFNSPLIISFLGYQSIIISTDVFYKNFEVFMTVEVNYIDEVVLSTDDGLSREFKLEQFKKNFIGTSPYAKSCKILNENDITLKYNKKYKTITASSQKPILIRNDSLKYEISYALQNFTIKYNKISKNFKWVDVKKVSYAGYSYYKPTNNSNEKKAIIAREKVYHGSVLHFMRSLANETLTQEGYSIINHGISVNPYENITVTKVNFNNIIAKVHLSNNIIVQYQHKLSAIQSGIFEFFIDNIGNHTPIDKVLFGGDFGDQRIGDALPLNYGLETN